jgi:PKD repeat protein
MFEKRLFWIVTITLLLLASIGGYMLYSSVRLLAQEPTAQESTAAATQEPTSVSSPTAVVEPTSAAAAIVLEPAAGPVGTTITIQGEGWNAGSTVLIYLLPSAEAQDLGDAVSGAVVGPGGQFTTSFVLPSDGQWEGAEQAIVIARAADGTLTAQATFAIVAPTEEPTQTPVVVTTEPTATPTQQASAPKTVKPAATPAPTSTPIPTPTPVVISDWRGEYYNNPNLSGNPVLVRNDVSIDFDWGTGSPGPGVPVDGFSARWSRSLNFSAGTYRFYALADDGVRLWIDGNLVIDQWHDSSPTTYTADVTLSAGWHTVVMEYYEDTGGAVVQLTWGEVTYYPDWKGEYYNNPDLSGDPVLVRNDVSIDFNWGTGSPDPLIPADGFSVRWSRSLDFSAGTYRFYARVDDGVRLWIDDNRVINHWKDGAYTTYTADVTLTDGSHSVVMEYYEDTGGAAAKLTWKKVNESTNKSPSAVISGPSTVKEGELVTFDGSGSTDPDGSIVKYEWDLDYSNGVFSASATGRTVSISYPDGPATAIIALRVTDDSGASDIATSQVTVVNVPPTADAGGPYSGQVGTPIAMAGTGTDPGPVDQKTLTYQWSFGDGTHGSGQLVSHSYQKAGNYQATLTVIDKDGGRATDTATVQVWAANQPPTAVISGPTSGLVGQTLTFSGSGSSDPDGQIVSYAWDLGDGTTASKAKVSHSYNAAGTYQVTLTVTDNGGLSSGATQSVQISQPAANQPPTAVISGPTSGLVGQKLTFSGSGSSDPDGQIVTYAWDLGDGTTASAVEVSHSYNAAGAYQVTLTVTDNGGLSDSATQTVQVTEPVAKQPPMASIVGQMRGLVGQTLTFSGSGSTDPDGQVVSYAWDLGDGTTASGAEVSHSYSAAGSYRVTLTVTDNDGLSSSASLLVQVNEPVS